MEALEPWQKFLVAFRRVLDSRPQQDILDAWSALPARTTFYASAILPKVANALGFKCKPEEFLNIDHVFRDSCGVPRAFIESENNAAGAQHEIRKLCAVSCPLRVLLTVVEWDKTDGVWTARDGSRQVELLRKWREIIEAHHQVYPSPGLLALLVGELCNPVYYRKPTHPDFQRYRLRFYAHHFDTKKREWQADGIYQRYLAGPNQNGEGLDGWPS